jgi:hypothetical protein
MPTSMPTAAKATGAASFAILGWMIANAYVPGMPDAGAAGGIREYAGGIGAIVGWGVMGNSVGNKYIDSIGYGWKTAVVLVFVATMSFSIYEMLLQSTRMVYDGPIEAIADIFLRMFDRTKALLTFSVLTTMIVGGAVAGLLTEGASRRWP